ncbi:hypothetical protein [Streptomyces sp. NPDC058045]|uniref:hypothetical protein n=1 Tax=Streptomyces sp. NPDC058045 TaxID=3346311 RepID=UPI0036E0A789
MTSEHSADAQDFVLTIEDIFTITGRGTVVVGPVASGVLKNGETVEVREGDQVITTGRAFVEFVCRPGRPPRPTNRVSLCLGTLDRDLLKTGQTIRRRTPPTAQDA